MSSPEPKQEEFPEEQDITPPPTSPRQLEGILKPMERSDPYASRIVQGQIGGSSSEQIERTKPPVPAKRHVVGTGTVRDRSELDTDYQKAKSKSKVQQVLTKSREYYRGSRNLVEVKISTNVTTGNNNQQHRKKQHRQHEREHI